MEHSKFETISCHVAVLFWLCYKLIHTFSKGTAGPGSRGDIDNQQFDTAQTPNNHIEACYIHWPQLLWNAIGSLKFSSSAEFQHDYYWWTEGKEQMPLPSCLPKHSPARLLSDPFYSANCRFCLSTTPCSSLEMGSCGWSRRHRRLIINPMKPSQWINDKDEWPGRVPLILPPNNWLCWSYFCFGFGWRI